MDGNADRARLIGNGARDRLADPPCRIGAELVALVVVELLDRLDEAEVAFLYEIEEQHSPADIALGDAHDEAQIRLRQLLLRFLVTRFHALGKGDFLVSGKERNAADFLEIHAHGIVDADSLGNAEVDVRIFLALFLIYIRLCAVRVVHDLDALVAERLVKVVDFIRRELLFLQRRHQLAIGQHAAVSSPDTMAELWVGFLSTSRTALFVFSAMESRLLSAALFVLRDKAAPYGKCSCSAHSPSISFFIR